MTFDEWTKTSILWNGIDWYLNQIDNQPKSVRTIKPSQQYVPEVVMKHRLSKSELDKVLDSFNHELVLNNP